MYKLRLPYHVLVLLLFCCLSAFAGQSYQITINLNDFEISQKNDFTRIDHPEALTIYKIGYPELPMMGYKYYISSNMKITGINIISVTKQQIPGSFNIYPIQEEPEVDRARQFTEPDDVIYGQKKLYPGTPIEFIGVGTLSGHRIADIVVFPFEYVPAENSLYFYSSIEFEFIEEGIEDYTPCKRRDDNIANKVRGMVQNNGELIGSSTPAFNIAKIAGSMTIDSIPCVIITNLQMQSAFEQYAWWKTINGTRTEVMRSDVINMYYPGNTIQDKIRAFINDYHYNKYTDWIIIGGDVSIIPGVKVYACDTVVLSDQYYSCIDTNYHWNGDGDTLFGEPEWYGDTVDYYPDVWVGRIPVTTADTAQAYIDKLMTYQTDTSIVGYQTKALFLGSDLDFVGDAETYLNSKIMDKFPGNFQFTSIYNDDTALVEAAVEGGVGIIINTSHANGYWNFLTRYDVVNRYIWEQRRLYYRYIETWDNNNQFPVFINNTCHNNMLNYYELDTVYHDGVVSKSFMNNPNGGGIAYIGSTYKEWSFLLNKLQVAMVDSIFNGANRELGRILSDIKYVYRPTLPAIDNIYRFALFSYMYLGDPQLEMWTTQPKKLRLYLSVDTVMAETTANISIIVVDEYDDPVSDALVCLTKGYDGVYELTYTGEYGEAAFDNIYFPAAGTATVVAHKSNCFPVVDSIEVISGGGGCPMLYVYNGTDYQFVNNILAQSEDFNLPLGNHTDYYPIYSVPLLDNNSIKVRIQEGGKEKSYIDQLAVNYIYYPIDKQIAYTNKNEFKYLSGNYLVPISAVNDNGKDVLDQITAFDELHYSSTLPGSIVVKYKCPDGIGKIADEGGGGIEPPPGGKGSSKVLADDVLDRNVVVSILDESGNWQAIDTHYPRVMKTGRFTDLSDYWSGSELTVKIEWNSDIAIDCLPYYFFESDIIAQNEVSLSSLVHNINGDMSAEAEAADDNELTLSPGEYINSEFDGIPYLRQHRIAAVLKAVGRYEQITDDGTSDDGFTFDQNYPNPFNPATTFSFSLPVNTDVNLSIFNILGQKVAELVNNNMIAGHHEVAWDGQNMQGQPTASGIYFAKFKAGEYTSTKKIMIVK